jgi:hypothetical protein
MAAAWLASVRQAKRSRGAPVNHELALLLYPDWKLGRPFPAQDLVYQFGGVSKHRAEIRSVGHQAS